MSEPKQYRKKPVVIEAMRLMSYTELLLPGSWNDNKGGDIWRWMNRNGAEIQLGEHEDGLAYGIISTLEGNMRVDIGDWIIRGVHGEFYPCKPDIFEKTYEEESK